MSRGKIAGESIPIAASPTMDSRHHVAREKYPGDISSEKVPKPLEDTFRCKLFLWKEEPIRLLVGSPGASTTPIYSPGSSSTPIILQDLQHLHAILQELQHLKVILWELQEMQSAQTASTCLIR
ncbi:hypothetical protein Tco_0117042 [Tanacetum coccineum]